MNKQKKTEIDRQYKQAITMTAKDYESLGDNWFTIAHASKKLKIKGKDVQKELLLLSEANIVYAKDFNGTLKFKVITSENDKIEFFKNSLRVIEKKKKEVETEFITFLTQKHNINTGDSVVHTDDNQITGEVIGFELDDFRLNVHVQDSEHDTTLTIWVERLHVVTKKIDMKFEDIAPEKLEKFEKEWLKVSSIKLPLTKENK